MSSEPDISFIMCVYNGEKTLEHAVNSVIRLQAVKLELLLIDDGSTDSTPRLCDTLASADSRIRVFHKQNEGVGLSRTFALKNAAGKYLFFCDADDEICGDGVMQLLSKINEGYDVVCGMYYRTENGKTERVGEHLPSGEVSRVGDDAAVSLFHKIKTESTFGYSTNKLYRRSFLEETGVLFEDNRRVINEDTLFNSELFSRRPRYYFLNVPVYNIIINGPSISHGPDPKIAEKSVAMLACYNAYLRSFGMVDENMDIYVPLAMRLLCWALFKNMPYEGISYRALLGHVHAFTGSEAFRCILHNKGRKRELRKLPSVAQQIFYGYCYSIADVLGGNLLALTFAILYPAFKLYIGKTLK